MNTEKALHESMVMWGLKIRALQGLIKQRPTESYIFQQQLEHYVEVVIHLKTLQRSIKRNKLPKLN